MHGSNFFVSCESQSAFLNAFLNARLLGCVVISVVLVAETSGRNTLTDNVCGQLQYRPAILLSRLANKYVCGALQYAPAILVGRPGRVDISELDKKNARGRDPRS